MNIQIMRNRVGRLVRRATCAVNTSVGTLMQESKDLLDRILQSLGNILNAVN